METAATTVHLVDDDRSMLRALERTVRSAGWTTQVHDCGQSLLDHYEPTRCGCVVTDLRMPGMSGLSLRNEIRKRDECVPIIFMTAYGDVPTAVDAMRNGAVDFLLKPFTEDALLSRIEQAVEQGEALHRLTECRRVIQARLARLSRRQREVLDLVIAGHLNKQISGILGIHDRTVEFHRQKLMQKMEAESLPELVRLVLTAEGLGGDSFSGISGT